MICCCFEYIARPSQSSGGGVGGSFGRWDFRATISLSFRGPAFLLWKWKVTVNCRLMKMTLCPTKRSCGFGPFRSYIYFLLTLRSAFTICSFYYFRVVIFNHFGAQIAITLCLRRVSAIIWSVFANFESKVHILHLLIWFGARSSAAHARRSAIRANKSLPGIISAFKKLLQH